VRSVVTDSERYLVLQIAVCQLEMETLNKRKTLWHLASSGQGGFIQEKKNEDKLK
jgi:hypothetical protein